jgi:MFS family permease
VVLCSRWLGATSFFDGFDRSVLSVALPQIRETFGLSQSQASMWISLIFLGALPALFITRRRRPRRAQQLLMYSIVGYTVATVATAAAPNVGAFVTMQFLGRLFLNAEAAIVWTFAAEEVPAKFRGFGFGGWRCRPRSDTDSGHFSTAACSNRPASRGGGCTSSVCRRCW